ncbi:MAG: hypothetical protein U0992_10885 [Planctomycetaceae bacterium]
MNQHHHKLTRATHDALLLHLSRERDWLQAARDSLLLLRRSAMTGDLSALDRALHEQAALTAVRSELSTTRERVFRQAANELGVPQQPVTLLAIAARLPVPARKPVLAVRRELAQRARHVRTVAAGTLSLLAQTRQFVDGILGDLLGATPTEARYSSDGQRQESTGRALVECRT